MPPGKKHDYILPKQRSVINKMFIIHKPKM